MTIQAKVNPLLGYMRQPKIYVRLPSNGLFWDRDSIDMPENSEFPVYSMTAKDELTFKTPDALMNGQAVVDVIQSCIPNIKDAWRCPGIDVDLILVAIRIATYGSLMTISHQVPGTDETVDHQIDLTAVLDQILSTSQWNETVEISPGIICGVKPLSYRLMTDVSIRTFESKKTIQSIADSDLTDEQKLELFNQGISKLTDLTVEMIAQSVFYVKTPDNFVEDKTFIQEFIQNADAGLIQKIQDLINENKKTVGILPLTVHATEEQILAGAPDSYELPVTMDNSNFFDQGS
jgi:hypothetical protein